MELNIVHLYHDLLNTYGDDGNIKILCDRAKRRNIKVNLENVTVGEKMGKSDIVFLGGGQDFEQTIASEDLIKNRREFLKGYVEDGGVCLCICGGYQLMGEYYVAANGEKMEGLSILPIKTDVGENRIIGNIVIDNPIETLVGFENHSGRTDIGNLEPLGTVLVGGGNNGIDKKEGAIYKNTICTYMHGPFLSKNPKMADEILLRALIKRYGSAELEPLDDFYENEAKAMMLKKLQK